MTSSKHVITDLISRFSPLHKVEPKYFQELAEGMKIEKFSAGKTLFKKNQQGVKGHQLLHFLIDGCVEIRESFDKRHLITADKNSVSKSLESRLPKSGTVKADQDCRILIVNNLLLEQLLSHGQKYTVYYVDEGEVPLTDDTLIDDNFQEDWTEVFLRSHLASNLPNQITHKLLSQLEDVSVKANDRIVKAKTSGDYFYIVKKGTATVVTPANGPFKGSTFPLDAGQHFGDEALVAGTPRNADVIMATDGVVGRLSAELFGELIKPYLIPHLHEKIKTETEYKKVIDVRFAPEYQQSKTNGSDNIPICYLRQQLNNLPKTFLYIVTPANDTRAELATYIMRQAGYNAYYQGDNLFRVNMA
jgi:CRP-like cAMP-binding protein